MNAGLVSKVPEALTNTVGAFFVAEKQPRQLVTNCQNKVTHNAQTNSSCVRTASTGPAKANDVQPNLTC